MKIKKGIKVRPMSETGKAEKKDEKRKVKLGIVKKPGE